MMPMMCFYKDVKKHIIGKEINSLLIVDNKHLDANYLMSAVVNAIVCVLLLLKFVKIVMIRSSVRYEISFGRESNRLLLPSKDSRSSPEDNQVYSIMHDNDRSDTSTSLSQSICVYVCSRGHASD